MRAAFSLIELLVVISIVAILAAAAMPTVRAYNVRSKLVSTLPMVEGNIQQWIKQYMIPEKAVTHQTIGRIGATVYTAAPAGAPNFLQGFDIFSYGGTCSKPGRVLMFYTYYDANLLGLSATQYDTLITGHFVYNINGTYVRKCYPMTPAYASYTPHCSDNSAQDSTLQTQACVG